MFRPRLVAASGAVLLCAAPSVAAAVSASHATFWHNKANTVTCGLMIVPKEVLCSAEGIPAPPHTTSTDGDPGFVQLAASGNPKTLRLSQDSFVGTTPVTLGHEAKWTGRGVTCTTESGTTVRCVNGEKHGFVIGNGHYTPFYDSHRSAA
jgi:hypothetical protein